MVKIQTCVTQKFEAEQELRQRNPLSTVLCNLTVERIIKEAEISITGLMFHKKHRGQSKEELVRIMADLAKVSKRRELKFSEDLCLKYYRAPRCFM